jgi:5-methylcytosine-specific restriction endonuclease McrA
MAGTLVLNASYEPLCVVPLRRAVILVMAEKATVVAADQTPLRSASISLDAPAVIRLTRYVRIPYKAHVPFSKKAVLARDGHRCAYCGRKAGTIDHVVPKALGGQDLFTNTVAACARCNGKKGSKTLAQMGWTLPFTPSAPSAYEALVIGFVQRDPSWAPYLPAIVDRSQIAPAV